MFTLAFAADSKKTSVEGNMQAIQQALETVEVAYAVTVLPDGRCQATFWR